MVYSYQLLARGDLLPRERSDHHSMPFMSGAARASRWMNEEACKEGFETETNERV